MISYGVALLKSSLGFVSSVKSFNCLFTIIANSFELQDNKATDL